MPDFTPTPEQSAIIDFARNTTDNLAVVARAGAAKTSTLVMIAEALPETSILCLAFNKSIATEMNERLPPNCEAKTLHALGYKAWFGFIRKKCKLDDKKCFNLLKDEVNLLQKAEQEEAFETFAETLDFIRTAKNEGYLPSALKGHWKPLVSDEDFYLNLPMEPSSLQVTLVDKVLIKSFRQAQDGILDFADMIYCPALCSVSWPTPQLTLVDEAQDLSPINHHILKKLVKRNRLIAVGDPCQAIYGFRGALADSMDQLIEKFSMETLYLTISFRCARNIVNNAHWLAPDMKAPEWAKEGEVHRLITWSPSMLQNGDAIICRNNAPLFRAAIRLIEAGLLPELKGRDLATPLKKIMNKLGKPKDTRDIVLHSLAEWKQKELSRARPGARGAIHDKAACLQVIIERTETLGDAIAYLDHLLNRDGRIYLMTGHGSKGLEYERVWFLDPQLCRIDKDQDANIKYVIETRAKTYLAYVDSETWDAH